MSGLASSLLAKYSSESVWVWMWGGRCNEWMVAKETS
jgi:hypothetical protein